MKEQRTQEYTALSASHADASLVWKAAQQSRDWVDRIARESPSRLALAVFATIILILTSLLQMPVATASGIRAPFVDSFFTATSAVCVTGLVTVDTATYWSPVGQFFIALGMMVGGLGVMTLASLLGIAVSRRIGLTQRMLVSGETQSRLGEVGSLLRAVFVVALSVQIILFVVLTPFFLREGEPLLAAFWHAFFMSASIFNNGGFVIMPEGLNPHIGDWSLSLPIILGTIIGAMGFPVLLDMWQNRRRVSKWSITTKITLVTYFSLFVLGALAIAVFEFGNPETLGPLNVGQKLDAILFHSATARSSGLSTVDVGQMKETTWFALDALMFVGGGSASAAGGIKVTTLGVLVVAIVAEARGDRDTEVFGRRIPPDILRVAIAATFVGASLVGGRDACSATNHGVTAFPSVVRGDIGIRNLRFIHGDHRKPARHRKVGPHRPHVRWTYRNDVARRSTRYSLSPPHYSASRRTSHDRLKAKKLGPDSRTHSVRTAVPSRGVVGDDVVVISRYVASSY